MAGIVFFCHGKKADLETFEYYKQDIDALERLGHNVTICNSYLDLPRTFDAMLVWWWSYALLPVLWCRMLGKPCLITGVFNFSAPPSLGRGGYHARPWWQRLLLSAATRLAARNLFIHQNELEACGRYFNISSGRHYPCILHEDYLQGPSEDRKCELFNVCWSGKGNLVRKGVLDLLEAVNILKRQGVDVHLTLAGAPGDGAEVLRERISALGLETNVTSVGLLSRADKIAAFRKFEIYAQPSHYEGFGLATAEAMGSGACVVVCDVGAVRSVVGDCGVYVDPGQPESLARGLRTAMEDTQLRRAHQAAAVRRMRSQFARQNKLTSLRQILAEVGIS
jgi:glycosyltransferase involved in cell wall biosynthesis